MRKDKHETYSNMEGDGHPSCKECGGRGVITVLDDKAKVPKVVSCKCVMLRNIVFNLEKRWPGLVKAKKVKQSPLKGWESENLWITASQEVFRAHMRYVALRKGPQWDFRGCSDKDLANAWLAVAKAEGRKILDRDVAESTIKYMTLEDLIEPPDLLVIFLGIKGSPNKNMPDLIVEALNSRAYTNKATWIVDFPSSPLKPGHKCYSAEVNALVSEFKRIKIGGASKRRTPVPITRPTAHVETNPYKQREEEDALLNGRKKKKNRWNNR